MNPLCLLRGAWEFVQNIRALPEWAAGIERRLQDLEARISEFERGDTFIHS